MSRPVAFVTGASRGIGKAAALALAGAGFDVVIGARTLRAGSGRDDSEVGAGRPVPGSLEETAAEVAARGARALPVRMDLLDFASLEAAVTTAYDTWGRVDVLVNNAVHTGPGSMTHFLDLDLAVLRTKFEANVFAQFALTKAVVPRMIAEGGGTVVNITSAVAVSDPPAPAGRGGWGLAYAMSKGAFHRIAGILAVELGDRGIRAFNVEPGFVVTERMEANAAALGYAGRYRGCPPSVVGAVVAWLAANADGEAASLNGQTVPAQRFALERRLHPDWRRPA